MARNVTGSDICGLMVLDCERKGNLVRLYLGRKGLDAWGGDDWNDAPYEHNAGPISDKFVTAVLDVCVPWDRDAVEPCDGHLNSRWSKDDMRALRVPMLCVTSSDTDFWVDFEDVAFDKAGLVIYMGTDAQAVLDGLVGAGCTIVGFESEDQS